MEVDGGPTREKGKRKPDVKSCPLLPSQNARPVPRQALTLQQQQELLLLGEQQQQQMQLQQQFQQFMEQQQKQQQQHAPAPHLSLKPTPPLQEQATGGLTIQEQQDLLVAKQQLQQQLAQQQQLQLLTQILATQQGQPPPPHAAFPSHRGQNALAGDRPLPKSCPILPARPPAPAPLGGLSPTPPFPAAASTSHSTVGAQPGPLGAESDASGAMQPELLGGKEASAMADEDAASAGPASAEHAFRGKGPWTEEEDQELLRFVEEHGARHWRKVPKVTRLRRDAQSCRLRWTSYLSPHVSKLPFTPEEDKLLLECVSWSGETKWATIAAHKFPKRTGYQIQRRWHVLMNQKRKASEGGGGEDGAADSADAAGTPEPSGTGGPSMVSLGLSPGGDTGSAALPTAMTVAAAPAAAPAMDSRQLSPEPSISNSIVPIMSRISLNSPSRGTRRTSVSQPLGGSPLAAKKAAGLSLRRAMGLAPMDTRSTPALEPANASSSAPTSPLGGGTGQFPLPKPAPRSQFYHPFGQGAQLPGASEASSLVRPVRAPSPGKKRDAQSLLSLSTEESSDPMLASTLSTNGRRQKLDDGEYSLATKARATASQTAGSDGPINLELQLGSSLTAEMEEDEPDAIAEQRQPAPGGSVGGQASLWLKPEVRAEPGAPRGPLPAGPQPDAAATISAFEAAVDRLAEEAKRRFRAHVLPGAEASNHAITALSPGTSSTSSGDDQRRGTPIGSLGNRNTGPPGPAPTDIGAAMNNSVQAALATFQQRLVEIQSGFRA